MLVYPKMVEARAKYQAAQDKEVTRQLKFDSALRESEHAELSISAPHALEVARTLARRESEKKAIELLVKRRAALSASEQTRRDESIAPVFVRIDQGLAAIEELLGRPMFEEVIQQQSTNQIAATLNDLNSLADDLKLASPETQSRARAKSIRLDAARARFNQRKELWDLERKMTSAIAAGQIRNPEAFNQYADLLSEYVKKAPEQARAKAFAQTLREKPIWDGIAAWCALVSSWHENTAELSTSQAEERSKACSEYLARYPNAPGISSVADYCAFLKSLVRRDTGAKSSRNQLTELLSTLLVDDVWILRYKDPKLPMQRFYLAHPYEAKGGQISHLVGFEGKEQTRFLSKGYIESTDLSPQTKIARRFKDLLAHTSKVVSWEKITTDLMAAVKNDYEMDPLLKVALLRKICDYAGAGSFALKQALAPYSDILGQKDVDINVPWMDPGNPDANRIRPKAQALIAALPNYEEIGRKAISIAEEINAASREVPLYVGWLRCDDTDWKVQTPSPIVNDVGLWVAVPSGQQALVWKQAGEVQGGKVKVRAVDGATLAEGRPVFVMSGSGEDKS